MKRRIFLFVLILCLLFSVFSVFVACDDESEKTESNIPNMTDEFVFVVDEENNQCTVTKYLGESTKVIIPLAYKGVPVTAIGSNCFKYRDDIVSVVIPDSVISLGYMAFYGCFSLKRVEMSNNISLIGAMAFSSCIGLNTINIPSSIFVIGDEAFAGCTSLTNFIYGGLESEWVNVSKGLNWRENAAFETIKCQDNQAASPDSGNETPIDPEEPEEPELTGADFFENLINSIETKYQGQDAIDANEDIQASIALNLALQADGIADLDLSLLLDVVYDRAENGVGNTFSAAHIAIVDNNGSLISTGQNIIAANYYINDPTKLYLELCNEKVVLSFDATGDGNQNFATYLVNFLTSTFTAGLLEGLSIDGLIEAVDETFGPDFAIDNLAAAIGSLFGFDLNELIAMAADLLGLEGDVANLNGVLNAAGDLLIADGSVKKTTDGTSTVWEAALSGTVTNLVGEIASGLLDSQSSIKLITKVDAEGGIENFAVTANTAPFGENYVRYNAKIAIDKFEIGIQRRLHRRSQPLR